MAVPKKKVSIARRRVKYNVFINKKIHYINYSYCNYCFVLLDNNKYCLLCKQKQVKK